MKNCDIMDIWQWDILTRIFFWKYLARQNGGLQSGHEFGTLSIEIRPDMLWNFLTKANAMGERVVLSRDSHLPTFSFTM